MRVFDNVIPVHVSRWAKIGLERRKRNKYDRSIENVRAVRFTKHFERMKQVDSSNSFNLQSARLGLVNLHADTWMHVGNVMLSLVRSQD
jgi:hypothetical protein